MIYIPANENLCGTSIGRRGRPTRPAAASPARPARSIVAPGADHIGEVQAWNVDTGQRVWTHTYREVPELGPDARHRRRAGVQRRHQRPEVPRLRRGDRQGAVGVPDQLRHHSASRRRSWSTASSTSPCSRAGASTRAAMQARLNAPDARRVSRGARGRRDLGVRGEVSDSLRPLQSSRRVATSCVHDSMSDGLPLNGVLAFRAPDGTCSRFEVRRLPDLGLFSAPVGWARFIGRAI